MATFLDPSGIVVGFPVQAVQVRQLYDALTPPSTPGHSGLDYNIFVNGNITVENGGSFTGTVTADNFQGSGALLTDVVLTSYLPNLTSTTTFNAFSQSYSVASASFNTRIIDNANTISNFAVASQSLDNKQKILRSDVDALSSSFETASGSLELRITNVSSSFETTIALVSESLDVRISSVSSSIVSTIDSVSSSLSSTIDSVSSSLAGDITILDSRVDDLSLSSSIHDVFKTGSCNTAVLPTNSTGNCITGNNTNVIIAGACNATMTATQGLANIIAGARGSKMCGNLVADSAIIGANAGCMQGNVGTSFIAAGTSNLIGGTQVGGGRVAGGAAIIGSTNSKIGNSGVNTNPGPKNSIILAGDGHCIETSCPAPTNAIQYSAILGGRSHSIVTEDVESSVIIGGCCSSVTTSNTIVLGSGLTGNLANHTFVEGLSVKDNATVGGTITATGNISGSQILADGSQLTNVRYEQSFTPSTSVTVTHNLNLDTPIVQVWSASGVQVAPADVTRVSSNQLTVDFAFSTTGSVVVAR